MRWLPGLPAHRACLTVSFDTDIISSNVSVLLNTTGNPAHDTTFHGDKIVVANRRSGTLSVIRVKTDEIVATIALPYDASAGEPLPEPMYVVYTRVRDRVFVGDRSNRRIVVYDAEDFSVVATIPGGDGIFHMWTDPRNRQVWVNNNIENTVTVIDARTLSVLTTIALPADLIADSRIPHDVMLDRQFAYITMVASPGGTGNGDYVLKYSLDTFEEVARARVGDDPHLALALKSKLLYVPTQISNTVTVLRRTDLEQVTDVPVPGAHGVAVPRSGNILYVTDLPGGQTDTLYTIDTRTNTLVGDPVDAPYGIAHNMVTNTSQRKLYVTHSGNIQNKVTVWEISNQDPVPVLLGEVRVGLNPFGIALVP